MIRITTILLASLLWIPGQAQTKAQQQHEPRLATFSIDEPEANTWIFRVYITPSPLWNQEYPLSTEMQARLSYFLPVRKMKLSREELFRRWREAAEKSDSVKRERKPDLSRNPWMRAPDKK